MSCCVPRLLSPRPSLLNTASDARLNSSPQKPLDLKQLKQRAAAIPPIVSTLLERAGVGSTACASGTLSHRALWCASALQGCAHPWGWPLVHRGLCLGGVSSRPGKVLPVQRVFPAAGGALPAAFGCLLSSFIRKSWEVWTEKASHCHMTAASRGFKKKECAFPALHFISCLKDIPFLTQELCLVPLFDCSVATY